MSALNNLALAVEDASQYGGAQRLAAILSKRFGLPLHCISKSENGKMCWDTRLDNSVPDEPVVFSITVDRYNKPIVLKSKFQIKFMHSMGTIAFKKDQKPILKRFVWVTHRKRVYDQAKKMGFRIYLVKNGYIPYDYKKSPKLNLKKKENKLISISRISKEKGIEKAIQLSKCISYPITIAGYNKDSKYFKKVEDMASLFGVSVSGKITEGQKIKLLERSKILLNTTSGGYRDYLEYSILDGMLYGCIPLCITSDVKQFDIINKKKLGIVISDASRAGEATERILENYGMYYRNCRSFMKKFIGNQPKMINSYKATLISIMNGIGE